MSNKVMRQKVRMKNLLCSVWVLALALVLPAAADAAVVTLAWDPVPSVAGYVVHYGTASGQLTQTVNVGNRTTFIFTPPTSGRYYFAVHAYDATGLSSLLSAEVSTTVEATPQTALTVDLAPALPSLTATAIDVAFDPMSRRYLLTYSSGGETWISMLDLWGTAIGTPVSLTPNGSGAQPRVAVGGGNFLVVYTDTTAGQRVGRFVQAGTLTPTIGAPSTLGPATAATGDTDNPGGAATYDFADNRFVATWENAGNVFAGGISTSGPTGTAVNLTGDAPLAGCLYARPEVSWDNSLRRAMVLGSREGAGCTAGGAAWTRIVGYDGALVTLASDVLVVSTVPNPQTYRRVAFTNLQNRFLLLWSEQRAGATGIVYRIGDATGGLSSAFSVPSGGTLTPEPEDDAFTENAVVLDAAGTFSVVSRGNPAAGATAGQLYFQRIDANGVAQGSLHTLPATGVRTRVAMATNTVTGQILAAYLDANGHLRAMTIGARVPTTTTLSASAAAITVGQSVNLTSTASGGAAPYEFAFWRLDVTRGQWFAAQPWSTTAAVSWTPSSADVGTHTFQVWARSAGSTANYEAWQSVNVVVNAPLPLSVRLTADRTSPVQTGSTVTWTAVPTGGTGSIEYQFWLYDSIGVTWTVARPYGPSNVFAWTPATPGVFVVQVWARAVGSIASSQASAGSDYMTVAAPPPATITSVTATRSTATPGTAVLWTAQASGGVGPLQYQFWKYNVGTGTWTIVRPYATSATYSWTPGAADAGSYMIQVWVKGAGSTADYDGWMSSNTLTVTNVTLTNLRSSVTLPSRVGTAITWTATATAVAGTIEYEFWVYSVTTATWQVMRAYGTSASAVWTPATAGQYTVQVWARAVGNSQSYEVWRGNGPFVINP